MSKFRDMIVDIQDDIDAGILSFGAIAERYDVPREFVEDIYDAMCDTVDCDDSDDGYALASAGMGTDEDYGYYGDDF